MKKSLTLFAAAMCLIFVSVPPVALAANQMDGNPEGPPPPIMVHPTGSSMTDGNPEGPPPPIVIHPHLLALADNQMDGNPEGPPPPIVVRPTGTNS